MKLTSASVWQATKQRMAAFGLGTVAHLRRQVIADTHQSTRTIRFQVPEPRNLSHPVPVSRLINDRVGVLLEMQYCYVLAKRKG